MPHLQVNSLAKGLGQNSIMIRVSASMMIGQERRQEEGGQGQGATPRGGRGGGRGGGSQAALQAMRLLLPFFYAAGGAQRGEQGQGKLGGEGEGGGTKGGGGARNLGKLLFRDWQSRAKD